jgi:hypothetical protein
MSQYTTEPVTNLPSTIQLGNYRTLTARLLDHPQNVSAEERQSFLKILGEFAPYQLTGDEIQVFESVFPTEWRAYSEMHWNH